MYGRGVTAMRGFRIDSSITRQMYDPDDGAVPSLPGIVVTDGRQGAS